ncbi:MAG: hypothetical protein KJ676_11145 [Alphaproteobacteria bacterium]|nr:hypothetical protein [Alphaproteobacteria bacterium]MBU1525561.1 hypothetical protein [Alphaproteobacteria bacterium]MBU2116965.1 hypothetical protein [Alphaproteobacteria bacterium]MBU2350496.1 hypothetical protein [Alphaproteobacteria bacterium]MBU2381511.1 hypothetical protein [Alphaproteobacteria bacterium]
MRYYVLSYDLRGEIGPQDYVRLADALRTAPDFCRALWSFWIVGTPLSPAEVINRLMGAGVIDSTDGVAVLEITGRGDWFNVHPAADQWLSAKVTRT